MLVRLTVPVGAVSEDPSIDPPAIATTQDDPIDVKLAIALYAIEVDAVAVVVVFPSVEMYCDVLLRYTAPAITVALVHVPLAVPAAVADRKPIANLRLADETVLSCNQPDGTVGAVAPDVNAAQIRKSPL